MIFFRERSRGKNTDSAYDFAIPRADLANCLALTLTAATIQLRLAKIRAIFLSSTRTPLIVVLVSVVKRALPFPSLLLSKLKAFARSCTNLRMRFSIGGSARMGAAPRSVTNARMCSAIVSRLTAAAAVAARRALRAFYLSVCVKKSAEAATSRSSSRRRLRSAFFARSCSH